MALADPFPLVKEEVQQSLGVAKALHARWKELVGSDSTSTEELQWTRNELENCISGIENDIEAMKKVVSRDRKSQIEPGELEARRAFVTECTNTVKTFRNDIMDPRLQKIQTQREEHQKLTSLTNGGNSREENARLRSQKANQEFIEDQQQMQQQIMRQQDEGVEELGQSVIRVKKMADGIGNELGDQQRMIEEMEGEMERTGGRLQMVMGKVDQLLKSSDNKKIVTIVVLILIIIGLFVAVIYA